MKALFVTLAWLLALGVKSVEAQQSYLMPREASIAARGTTSDPSALFGSYLADSATSDSIDYWLAMWYFPPPVENGWIAWILDTAHDDSVGIYLRIPDTQWVQILVSPMNQSIWPSIAMLQGPLAWGEYKFPIPKKYRHEAYVILYYSPFNPAYNNPDGSIANNEAGYVYFGRAESWSALPTDTIFDTVKDTVTDIVRNMPMTPDKQPTRYYDILGRECTKGTIICDLGRNRYLVSDQK